MPEFFVFSFAFWAGFAAGAYVGHMFGDMIVEKVKGVVAKIKE